MQMTFDLEVLRKEIHENWKKEFGGNDYFDIFLNEGKIVGTRYFSNKGDAEDIILRGATKYEIVIEDTYAKISSLLKTT